MTRVPNKPKVAICSTQSAMRVPRRRLAKLVEFVAAAEGAAVAEVDLAVVARDEMVGLNRKHLQHAGATDVLSFDLSQAGKPGISAQIIVCGDVAVQQARLRGISPQRELMLYVVHGLLHLMGYDDTAIRSGVRMHAREEEILDQFIRGKR